MAYIDSIRPEYIASNPYTGVHVETFGAIALESDAMAGIVHIWATHLAWEEPARCSFDVGLMFGRGAWGGVKTLTREILST